MDILKLVKDFENIKPRMEEFLTSIESKISAYDARLSRIEDMLEVIVKNYYSDAKADIKEEIKNG